MRALFPDVRKDSIDDLCVTDELHEDEHPEAALYVGDEAGNAPFLLTELGAVELLAHLLGWEGKGPSERVLWVQVPNLRPGSDPLLVTNKLADGERQLGGALFVGSEAGLGFLVSCKDGLALTEELRRWAAGIGRAEA